MEEQLKFLQARVDALQDECMKLKHDKEILKIKLKGKEDLIVVWKNAYNRLKDMI